MKRARGIVLLLALAPVLALGGTGQADEVCVPDAQAKSFCLAQPANRIVSLAPHLTEMAFAIGAGGQLVGAVSYSDFPPEARALPSLGNYNQPDLEKLLALKPDLALAWQSGASPALLDKLAKLGIPAWVSRSEHLADIPAELRGIGLLSGHAAEGKKAADAFEHELESIWQEHAHSRPLRGFYQIWPQPLLTVSDNHFIAEAMRYCAIENIVGQANNLTPTWSEEEVVRARPELILTSPPSRDFTRWQRWPQLPAVKNQALIVLPPDVLARPGPRLIQGVRALCAAADKVRAQGIENPSTNAH
ncbi:MAG: cobalamin-binding protein [Pseudomonadota bacterium]